MPNVMKACVVALLLVAASSVAAKAQDTTVAPARPLAKPAATRLSPPLTPKRAFLYSLLLPGFGQSRLDRGVSGALFASVELSALSMVRRSRADLTEARRYLTDTLPSDFVVSGTTLTPTGEVVGKYTSDLTKTRRLHVEDWVAVLAFNHLFAGADAFVAAQLWDVPVTFSALPSDRGTFLVATLHF
jgi:hypothetical protein